MKQIHVLCIVEEQTYTELKLIDDMQAYCNKHNIVFGLRLYNPEKYFNDKEYIEQFPCFHVYIDNEYYTTLNISNNPLGYLKYLYDTYNVKVATQESRKESWLQMLRKVRKQNVNSLL